MQTALLLASTRSTPPRNWNRMIILPGITSSLSQRSPEGFRLSYDPLSRRPALPATHSPGGTPRAGQLRGPPRFRAVDLCKRMKCEGRCVEWKRELVCGNFMNKTRRALLLCSLCARDFGVGHLVICVEGNS